jgi:hypothetical protein
MVQLLETKTQHLCCPHLPLAIYREVVAHLHQVEGVEAGLIPQRSQVFDYLESQIAGLWLDLKTDGVNTTKIQEILAHYAQRYGDWQELKVSR